MLSSSSQHLGKSCSVVVLISSNGIRYAFLDEEQQQQPSKQQLPVPVPVYCRPLMEKEPGMKVRSFKWLTIASEILSFLKT
jgi:hypothetical protein